MYVDSAIQKRELLVGLSGRVRCVIGEVRPLVVWKGTSRRDYANGLDYSIAIQYFDDGHDELGRRK